MRSDQHPASEIASPMVGLTFFAMILKYVRPVIQLRAGQALSCPPAPVGVLDGCRADVSFIAGMIIDKIAYHQSLYRQPVKLQDSGINVSRAWITKPMPAAVSLVEPIFNARSESVRRSRMFAANPLRSDLHFGGRRTCAAA